GTLTLQTLTTAYRFEKKQLALLRKNNLIFAGIFTYQHNLTKSRFFSAFLLCLGEKIVYLVVSTLIGG
ncbi:MULTISPECIES: hypothetical protein, partial [unclassified Granulicatella]|uniref:hypothetical protein n=1 Tax=unclassified Granulicatella TaxID=2630493 RepID=UPI0018844751